MTGAGKSVFRRAIAAAASLAVPVAVGWGVNRLLEKAEQASGPQAAMGKLMRRTRPDGSAVSLREGPAIVAALLVGSPWVARRGQGGGIRAGRALASYGVAIGGSAVAGILDDHGEQIRPGYGQEKGLHGHLGALREGRITTGFAKIIIIGASGLASAALLAGAQQSGAERRGVLAELMRAGISATAIAGWANVINLLDLRPGRALKVALVIALPALPRGAAPVVAAGASVLAEDLVGHTMLGDTGANALGAALGWMAASSKRSVSLLGASCAVVLTIASEKVSFSQVIARQPLLRAIDQAGRA